MQKRIKTKTQLHLFYPTRTTAKGFGYAKMKNKNKRFIKINNRFKINNQQNKNAKTSKNKNPILPPALTTAYPRMF